MVFLRTATHVGDIIIIFLVFLEIFIAFKFTKEFNFSFYYTQMKPQKNPQNLLIFNFRFLLLSCVKLHVYCRYGFISGTLIMKVSLILKCNSL